jgi:hypothetical protein
MQARVFFLIPVLGCLVLAAPVLAQEGHPLVGSWHGDRGPGTASRTSVTLIIDWDGTVLSGLVNPVDEHAAVQNEKLNPKDWTVHFEVELKDNSASPFAASWTANWMTGSDRRTLAAPGTAARRKMILSSPGTGTTPHHWRVQIDVGHPTQILLN